MLWTFRYAHISLPPLSTKVFTEHDYSVKKNIDQNKNEKRNTVQRQAIFWLKHTSINTHVYAQTYYVGVCTCIYKCDDCAATVAAVVAICRQ